MGKVRRSGFTVIEILIAISLTMVVGWLVSMAFNNASTTCKEVTATLDYEAKGQAIMDMIARDINNCCHFRVPTVAATSLALCTQLPRLRTRYGAPKSDNSDLGSNGSYKRNIVFVNWTYDNAGKRLYRYASMEDNVNSLPEATATAEADSLVTNGDIRDFSVTASSQTHKMPDGTAASIPNYITVSFYLTNAPADVKSPADPTVVEVDSDYMWAHFSRVIATR